jgi:exodeoxyribonuclease VII small subunit
MTAARKSQQKPDQQKPDFEKSLRRLEAIVELLEQGDVPLEESLRIYEEGVHLSRSCLDHLRDAELRLKKLTRDGAGQFILSDAGEEALPRRPAGGKGRQ